MLLDEPQEGNLAWDPRTRFQHKLTTKHITDQVAHVVRQPVRLQRKAARQGGVAPRRDKTRVQVGITYLVALVQKKSLASAMLEAGVVSVLHKDHEVESDVELNLNCGE